jgi:nitrous oxidase accessory protein NosD
MIVGGLGTGRASACRGGKRVRWAAFLGALLGMPLAAASPQAPGGTGLVPGMVITRSIRIRPGIYRLPAPASLDSAAVTIRGDNLVVDLTGVTLLGTDSTAAPDEGRGVALRIAGGRNVQVIGARIRGYRIGILATGTRGLTLRRNDASYNWKPRLYSLVEHESLVDWLSYHHNEKREWMRYGAGLYLEDVKGGEVRANQVTQGMNGLLLVRSDSLVIRDNAFWFNSGLGIGLYRSSDNTIVRNRLDYNVRGYRDGFYHRGQDSAGLLLYEQSSRNVVAWNSVTHGGDGLFLWAGQSTMDTGQGGANDNVFYANDFSFAPANAIEATFSRNVFLANRAQGSDYGVWAGYSFETVIAANCFASNRVGIAIEHGQNNRIAANRFEGEPTAIALWADPLEPSDWGYPKVRDTRSRGVEIRGNWFANHRVAVRARATRDLRVAGNRVSAVDSLLVLDDSTRQGLSLSEPGAGERGPTACGPGSPIPPEFAKLVPALPGVPEALPVSPVAWRDRSAIVVDEWGPFDWRSPALWAVDSLRATPLRLRTGGPAGTWRVVDRRGLSAVGPLAGRIGDTVTVTPAPPGNDWAILLEYRGGATVSPRGVARPAGVPSRFGLSHWEPVILWDARFYEWSDSVRIDQDPARFDRLARQAPRLARQLSRLDLQGYRARLPDLPVERWALEATGVASLPAGSYRLRTISDDGIRVWVDGALVIDHWSGHESEVDTVALGAGRHEIRVRYYQDRGWAELRVEIVRES